MNSISKFMEEDHDKLDKIFKEFRIVKGAESKKTKKLFHDFKIGLQRHIVWEEEILFPIFEDKTGMHDEGPTAIMKMEHCQIKEFLEKIHDITAKKETNGIDELKVRLFDTLKAHNDKEENILYPWIDGSVSDKERDVIFKKMKNLPAEKYNKCCG